MIYRSNVVRSPDDGGYYAEVWDSRTGETVETLPKRGTWKRRRTAQQNGDARAHAMNASLENQ